MTEMNALTSYHARQLGCGTALLESPGLHIIPSANRQYPDARQWTRPVLGVRLAESGIISVHPHYYLPVRDIIGSYTAPGPVFSIGFAQRVREALHRELPPSVVRVSPLFHGLAVDRPDGANGVAVERLTGDAAATPTDANWDVFVARNERGEENVRVGVFATNEPVWLLTVASVDNAAYRPAVLAALEAAAHAVTKVGRVPLLYGDEVPVGGLEGAGFVRYGVELSIGYHLDN